MAISRDGRVLAWLVNVDGWEVLRLRDLESEKTCRILICRPAHAHI